MKNEFNFIEACKIVNNNPEKVVVSVDDNNLQLKLDTDFQSIQAFMFYIADISLDFGGACAGVDYEATQSMWKIKEDEL